MSMSIRAAVRAVPVLFVVALVAAVVSWTFAPVAVLPGEVAPAQAWAAAMVEDGGPGHEGHDGQNGSDGQSGRRMTIGQALVLGITEGLTEYLPVSSTGHLLVAQSLMGIGKPDPGDPPGAEENEKDAADAYAIVIQAGAIIAVLGLYGRRVKQMLLGLAGKDRDGFRMAANIIAAFIPAAVIGLIFNKLIKTYLFGMWPVIAAWFVGGLAILALSRRKRPGARTLRGGKPLNGLNIRMAFVIGVLQCVAMWPGVSRSLVTIAGGLLVGLSMPAAVEFSFLLGLVTLTAATALDAYKHGHLMLQMFDAVSMGVGLLGAFIFAVVSVKWMVAYLNRHSLAVFGYYRVLIAVVAGALLYFGVI